MVSNQTAAKSKATAPAKAPAKAQRDKKGAHPADKSVAPKQEEAAPEKHEITEEQRQADRRADDRVKADAMAQFVNQQNGVQTPDMTAKKNEEFKAKLAALQSEYGVTAKVVVRPARADKVQMNGVTRPAADTLCGKIWGTADEISAQTHGVAAIASVKEHPAMKGINDHTIKTQYAKWRKFNGVTGRLPRIHAVHQVQGEYEGLAPVAPPAETKAE